MKAIFFALSMMLAGSAFAEDLNPLKTFGLPDGRNIVTDARNLTVYIFDVDQGSESKCYDDCAVAWPPVLVDANTVVNAPVGKTTRKDGSLQLTLDGKPVYFFQSDAKAGDIKGDGLGGVWHIIVR